jgi:hypothetical protein
MFHPSGLVFVLFLRSASGIFPGAPGAVERGTLKPPSLTDGAATLDAGVGAAVDCAVELPWRRCQRGPVNVLRSPSPHR